MLYGDTKGFENTWQRQYVKNYAVQTIFVAHNLNHNVRHVKYCKHVQWPTVKNKA